MWLLKEVCDELHMGLIIHRPNGLQPAVWLEASVTRRDLYIPVVYDGQQYTALAD